MTNSVALVLLEGQRANDLGKLEGSDGSKATATDDLKITCCIVETSSKKEGREATIVADGPEVSVKTID